MTSPVAALIFFICDLILRYVDVCILTIAYDPEVTNEVDDVICIYLALEAFQLQHPKDDRLYVFSILVITDY